MNKNNENSRAQERERERERANKNEELTIKQLEEKLKKKKLEEELAKKANKKSRDYDESMIGVCHTCHVPIYHDEPIFTPFDFTKEGRWHGRAGGVGAGAGGIYGGAGAASGGFKNRSTRENWVQCGFCYERYYEEKNAYEKYWKKHESFTTLGMVLSLPITALLTWLLARKFDKEFKLMWWWVIGGIIVYWYFLRPIFGWLLAFIVMGSSPNEPDRYRSRVKERKIYDLKRKYWKQIR